MVPEQVNEITLVIGLRKKLHCSMPQNIPPREQTASFVWNLECRKTDLFLL
jgi:hypothetical protein